MLKALYHKQMAELGSFISRDPKTGKPRSKKSRRGYIVLLCAIGLLMVASLGALALGISGIIANGAGWIYMSIISVLAVLLGVFGSVFNTYSGLYMAKDNEFLLSMPIPEKYILLVRMAGVLIMGSIYSGLMMVPAVIIYLVFSPLTVGRVVFALLNIVTVALVVLALSCALGWVVAQISARLKNKSFITVIVSVAFMAVYFWFCGNNGRMIMAINEDPTIVSKAFGSWLFLFGWMGRGADGAFVPFILSLLLAAGAVILVWTVLSRSFLKLTLTAVKSAPKKPYAEAPMKASHVRKALLRREWKHFLSSPTYMLNCGLGVLFMPAAAVMGILNKARLAEAMGALTASSPALGEVLPLIVAGALCMLSTMIDVTAPSVSLEGKTMWLVQSFPVEPWDALMAKLKMHMELALPGVVIAGAALCYAMGVPVDAAVMAVAIAALFTLLMANLGLVLNLKMPNLTWTTETVPIKQSAPVAVCIFGGWGLVLVLAGIYFLLRQLVSADTYAVVCVIVLAFVNRFLMDWIKKKGTALFASL